ncbi:hypothetical protein [Dankookia sp. P2]|uniref:hypothetical protein n=1 Tax=Dankookia sp. P2 TaxID=3423955 RepID=UPI003D663D93
MNIAIRFVTKVVSPFTAPMLRDFERRAPTEGEHVLGDMEKRAEKLSVHTLSFG